MDPTQVLLELLQLYQRRAAGDTTASDGIIYHLEDLASWEVKGGFPPDVEAVLMKLRTDQ